MRATLKSRRCSLFRGASVAALLAAVVALSALQARAQAAPSGPVTPSTTPAAASGPAAVTSGAATAAPPAVPAASAAASATPIAIVPLADTRSGSGATVTGALRVTDGKAIIAVSGTVTSGSTTTDVTVPRRGTLRVCASTSVKLAADSSVPAGEVPGLMMALDHGAVEASFVTGRNADILLTPDFRILISGPGAADVKVRLGQHGDTCVDNALATSDRVLSQGQNSGPGPNPGIDAPYVLVTSVFDGSNYRVQPGQRVMFQHGSTQEVVDQEKEPCGCPPLPQPGTNEFPLAQSAGLAPLTKPAPVEHPAAKPQISQPLVYKSPEPASAVVEQPKATAVAPAPAKSGPVVKKEKKKRGFFRSIGHFFKRIFGADN